VEESVSLHLNVTQDFSLQKEANIKTFNLSPIDAGPLVFFPKVNVYVGFDGQNVRAGTTVSGSESMRAEAGFGYDDGFYVIANFEPSFSASAGIPYKSTDLKAYLKEEVECLLYNVVAVLGDTPRG